MAVEPVGAFSLDIKGGLHDILCVLGLGGDSKGGVLVVKFFFTYIKSYT